MSNVRSDRTAEPTVFELSAKGRTATAQMPSAQPLDSELPSKLLRRSALGLPQVSELQTVRHFTRLSQRNFSIDTQFYPLGSCTMKYNPRGAHRAASLPGFLNRHPLTPVAASQGVLAGLYELQEILCDVTGMSGVSLAPMAGAQGEFAGVAMIRAYHEAREDNARTEIIVPTAAHGTNPATAVMCGYQVREVKVDASGDVDIDDLRAAVGPQTAGLMMTNPSTCGVFERKVKDIAEIVHGAGGLLYYDGANLNAILGRTRPGDMGFDVLHMNLHKTFATPHGGGGPGAGPVAVGERLLPYLPVPIVGKAAEEPANQDQTGGQTTQLDYRWLDEQDLPQSIGRLSAFMGNVGILLRALAYSLLLGREGMRRVSQFATLNANYMMAELEKNGFKLAYPGRRASHEFIISYAQEAKQLKVSAMDMAKRLLDFDVHAPTTYFPLLIAECFLIEPTETETKAELDAYVAALVAVREEARVDSALVTSAPHTLPVARLDDVKAARELDLVWSEANVD